MNKSFLYNILNILYRYSIISMESNFDICVHHYMIDQAIYRIIDTKLPYYPKYRTSLITDSEKPSTANPRESIYPPKIKINASIHHFHRK